MSFNINDVLNNMKNAATDAVKGDIQNIRDYIKEVFDGEKEALKMLAEYRIAGKFSNDEFLHELDREKDVLETQMLTIKIMTKAIAQKAINAAINVLIDAVKLAI